MTTARPAPATGRLARRPGTWTSRRATIRGRWLSTPGSSLHTRTSGTRPSPAPTPATRSWGPAARCRRSYIQGARSRTSQDGGPGNGVETHGRTTFPRTVRHPAGRQVDRLLQPGRRRSQGRPPGNRHRHHHPPGNRHRHHHPPGNRHRHHHPPGNRHRHHHPPGNHHRHHHPPGNRPTRHRRAGRRRNHLRAACGPVLCRRTCRCQSPRRAIPFRQARCCRPAPRHGLPGVPIHLRARGRGTRPGLPSRPAGTGPAGRLPLGPAGRPTRWLRARLALAWSAPAA